MGTWNKDAERIMEERFGKDTVISLATAEDGDCRKAEEGLCRMD